ncbi:hypothetical protein JW905_18000, partial [bacterium]|nr:hypothetical protein [candidate division CSSED10-310 bacterium]
MGRVIPNYLSRSHSAHLAAILFRVVHLTLLMHLVIAFPGHAIESAGLAVEVSTERSADLEQEFGIRVESLHLSAAGYMIDLRYKVVDETRYRELLSRPDMMVLQHLASGAVLGVPAPAKVGALRHSA